MEMLIQTFKEVIIIKSWNLIGTVSKEKGFSVEAVVSIEGKEHLVSSPRIYISIETSDTAQLESDAKKKQLEYEDIITQAAMACSLAQFQL